MHLRMGKGRTKIFCFLISLVLALGLYGASTGTVLAHSQSWTQTTLPDFDTGTPQQVQLADTGDGGVQLEVGGYYLYAFQGSSTSFWRYSTLDNTWETLAGAPWSTGQGAALAYDGGNYIYALQGGGTNTFMRYDIAANTWDYSGSGTGEVAPLPGLVSYGGDLVFYGLWDYDGDNDDEPLFYAVGGGGSTSFWRYDALGDGWENLSAVPLPYTVGWGGSLACVEFYDPDLFLLHGNGIYFSGYPQWGYQWESKEVTPFPVNQGGALAYDENISGGYIYALQGGGQTGFWNYGLSINSWAIMANTPYSVSYGGDLAGDGFNFFYALRGGGFNTFMRYDPGFDSWDYSGSVTLEVAPCPGNVNTGGALTRGNPQYQASGTFTSSVYDGVGAPLWGTMAWTDDGTNGQSVTMKVRTGNNADMSDATAWAGCPAATGGTDISGLSSVTDGDRYIQYRAELATSSGSLTPVLYDVTLNLWRVIPGDADGSGTVDSADITYMENVVAWDPMYSVCPDCCDANQDEMIDCRDITKAELLAP